jgi:hypothetical protein
MKGVKQLTWSRGLRRIVKAMHPEAFKADAPVIESGREADEVVLCSFEFGAWSEVWRRGAGPACMAAAAAWDGETLDEVLRAVIPGEYVLGSALLRKRLDPVVEDPLVLFEFEEAW